MEDRPSFRRIWNLIWNSDGLIRGCNMATMSERHYLCCVLFCVFFACAVPAQGQECFDGWVYHAGSCYGIGQEAVTWANAEELCRLYEASLAEIETSEENEFLKALAKNNSQRSNAMWLGATDIFSENKFVWITSKQQIGPFTDWYPGEPNQSGSPGGEDCLQLFGVQGWQWNDEDCDQTAYFICEARQF